MSADRWSIYRWSICPQCSKNMSKKIDAAIDAADKAYGKVPVEEYEKMRAEIPSDELEDETLREDWEIGCLIDGTFYFSYSCSCGKCGFQHSEKIEKQLKLE